MINEQPRTREELYQKIKESSKEGFILEDMIRLGFWPEKGIMPQDPAYEIHKRIEINKELNHLKQDLRNLKNEAFLLKKFKEERLKESKKKRLENKIKREEEKQNKSLIWKEKQNKEILYLGDKISKGLNNNLNNQEKLKKYNLTPYDSSLNLANEMGISLNLLRFLAFSRKVSKVTHYKRFQIPKKTGGFRIISAPMPKIKNAQYWILDNILGKIDIHDKAHGFVEKKSIITNAKLHIKSDIIINIDLKDFFPTISYKRVKGLFKNFGYSEAIATILSLICTEAETSEISLDNKKYFIQKEERKLPQGAPTSPAITNIICKRLDQKISKLAQELNFTYTRYADDLTFSTNSENNKNISKLLNRVTNIINYEGFFIHPKKTKIARKGSRREVTGIVINEKLSIRKDTLKKFRACLHQILRDGLKDKKWGNSNNILASINGFYNFIKMVDKNKAETFKIQINEINKKYGFKVYENVKKVLKDKNEEVIKDKNTTNNEKDMKLENKEENNKKWWNIF
ncbi:MAG: retron St85 family RNA-directed DNA polymerase [Candidatus Sericytochromatia bacterium]